MINKEYIINELPQIKEIKDEVLREKVINVWLIACEKGGWKRIDDIPFTLAFPTKITLLEHTRRVTEFAMKISEVKKELDKDVLIAGALLHDVGKLLEFKREGDKIVKSNFGKLVRHPVSGYGIAMEVGLPLSVCNIICAHSEEGNFVTRTNEAIVIHHCDFLEFEIEKNK